MAALKLGAVNLDYGPGIVEQGLGRCLDDASFARPRRPQEQKVRDRAAGRGQPCHVGLVCPDDLVNCFLLSNDEPAEFALQILRLSSRFCWIQ